ncbi:MAG: hypothetical protein HY964_09820 [Ignavibacteriales bacterium]|nr:hypothetical protein [Ignavibacteriales bacterium]
MKVLFVFLLITGIIMSGTVFCQVSATTQQSSSSDQLSNQSQIKSPNAVSYVPNKISYQGLLTTPLGTPVPDGLYEIKFELFNDLSAGASQWVETQSSINVKQGTFSVLLGSVSPLLGIFYQPLWLEITAVSGPGISSPILFTPRTELASAAYSLGPLMRDSLVGYNLPNGRLSIGSYADGSDTWSVDVKTGTFSSIRTKTIPGYGTTGFWADKGDSTGRNYLVLRTGGADRWSLGTMYNDNFSIYNWRTYQPNLTISSIGDVGIGNSAPTARLDVAGNVKIKDTLLVGSNDYTGRIDVFRAGLVTPTISIEQHFTYGGRLRLYNSVGDMTQRFEPDANGSGGFISVYRNVGTPGFEVDGNYNNTNNPRVSIYGNANSASFRMDQTADNSVMLPDSSISSLEILDEPGIARAGSGSTMSIARSTVVNVSNASITVPGPGYIVAHGYSLAQLQGDTIGAIIGGIETTIGTTPTMAEAALVGCTNERLAAVTYRWLSLAPSRTFYVGAAGTYTYYFNVARYSAYQVGSHTIYWPKLDLAYYPTSYGSVGAAIPEMEASSFANPSTESVQLPADNSTTTKYTVDLRELELRAATARAKAEKAERELMEAKMNLQNGSQR